MSLVLNHLHEVASHSDKNKMGLEQLAVCLGPVLLCPSSVGSDDETLEYSKHIEVLKYLLEIWGNRNSGTYIKSTIPGMRDRPLNPHTPSSF